jgi:hypothetical protein
LKGIKLKNSKILIHKSKPRAYVIYGVQNTVSKKWYIGKTKNGLQRRRSEHLRVLRSNKHHSIKLQNSFNKHGESVFQWHVLEDRIPEKISADKEKRWIALFDAHKNGYNMTEGGDGGNQKGWNHKKFSWNGVEYESLGDAVQKTSISRNTWRRRLRSGYTCDEEDTEAGSGLPVGCVWNGIKYPSLTIAANTLGVTFTTLKKRLAKGYTCDSDVPPSKHSPIGKSVCWNGVKYPSIAEAERQLGLKHGTLKSRITRGYTTDSEIKLRKLSTKTANAERLQVKCVWNGIEYSSVKEAAKALGIHPSTMSHRIKMGWVDDQSLPAPINTPCEITWEGVTYPSIKECAEKTGLKPTTMAKWSRKGYTCEADVPLYNDKKPICWNNTEYAGLNAAARALGVDSSTMFNRIAKGYTCDDDIHDGNKPNAFTWNGIEYSSITKAAQFLKVSRKTISSRIKNGYTCDADLKSNPETML